MGGWAGLEGRRIVGGLAPDCDFSPKVCIGRAACTVCPLFSFATALVFDGMMGRDVLG
jgi:hypothetical protein